MMNFDDVALDADGFSSGHVLSFEGQPIKGELKWLCTGYCADFIHQDGEMVVLGFLEPKDFVLAVSPMSTVVTLGDVEITSISRKKLIWVLRKFPEIHFHYKHFRRLHKEKIERYYHDLATKTAGERYFDLLERYPWVKKVANPLFISSYLRVSPEQYERMCRVE